jgi:hypothetical protein
MNTFSLSRIQLKRNRFPSRENYLGAEISRSLHPQWLSHLIFLSMFAVGVGGLLVPAAASRAASQRPGESPQHGE